MIYPFLNDIGKMKVSEALPVLGIIASDWKQDFALVPARPDGQKTIHHAVWRNNTFKVLTRIMRNNQRNN